MVDSYSHHHHHRASSLGAAQLLINTGPDEERRHRPKPHLSQAARTNCNHRFTMRPEERLAALSSRCVSWAVRLYSSRAATTIALHMDYRIFQYDNTAIMIQTKPTLPGSPLKSPTSAPKRMLTLSGSGIDAGMPDCDSLRASLSLFWLSPAPQTSEGRREK